jgi:WD40 repeat protein
LLGTQEEICSYKGESMGFFAQLGRTYQGLLNSHEGSLRFARSTGKHLQPPGLLAMNPTALTRISKRLVGLIMLVVLGVSGERCYGQPWAKRARYTVAIPGSVSGVAFAPNGKTLAACGSETINLFETATGGIRGILHGQKREFHSVAISPDGSMIATGDGYRKVRIWDLRTLHIRYTLEGHIRTVWAVAFAPDNNSLASSSSDLTVRLWDLRNGQVQAILHGHTETVNCVAFSPDGKLVASGSNDGTIKLWDVATQEEWATLNGHALGVHCLAFSPDGQLLAAGVNDRAVQLWHVPTRTKCATLRGGVVLFNAVAFSPNVNAVAFSPDGKTLAVGCGEPDLLWQQPGTVQLWDVASRKRLTTFRAHELWVTAVAFTPDGKTLATGSWDGRVSVWDIPGRGK